MYIKLYLFVLLIINSFPAVYASDLCLSQDDERYISATQSLFVAQQYLSSRPGKAIDQVVATSSIDDDLRQLLQERDKLRQIGNNQNSKTPATLAAHSKLTEIEKQIEERSPNLLKRLTFEPHSVSSLQERLGEQEALLILLETEKASFAWWIDRTCFRWNRLSEFSKTDAYNHISRLRDGISPSVNIRNNTKKYKFKIKEKPYPRAIAKDIHDKILGGFVDRMKNIQSVNLHANGNFLSIPFAALIDPQTGDFEIKNRNYTYLPSLSTLSENKNKISLSSANSILAIGAPKQDQNPNLQWLGNLPGAESELIELQKAYDNNITILSGTSATKDEFANAINNLSPEIVLFSTHAILDDSLGKNISGLLMSTDETDIESAILTPSEISRYSINSKLVILSACSTWSGADGGKGEALTGLALSFFQAGSKNLIVTHWPISDDSASTWSQILIEKMTSNNLTVAQTLRQSQLQLMEVDEGRWSHPKHWAPYIFISGDR